MVQHNLSCKHHNNETAAVSVVIFVGAEVVCCYFYCSTFASAVVAVSRTKQHCKRRHRSPGFVGSYSGRRQVRTNSTNTSWNFDCSWSSGAFPSSKDTKRSLSPRSLGGFSARPCLEYFGQTCWMTAKSSDFGLDTWFYLWLV